VNKCDTVISGVTMAFHIAVALEKKIVLIIIYLINTNSAISMDSEKSLNLISPVSATSGEHALIKNISA